MAYLPTIPDWILDTWAGAGLRGSGSHDLVLNGLRVPAELFVNPLENSPHHDGPLWRFPLCANLSVTLVGFPLAVARRALDEITPTRQGPRWL